MIDKREILGIASTVNLQAHVVEKDYALGWLLAGIYAHPELGGSWVFKGGTCLKKCYFETYRFSEDLDFTLQDTAHLDQAFLRRVFAEIGEWVYEQSGLQVDPADQRFDLFDNPRGQPSCQGRISYRGPVSPRSAPRIKLDLTADERLVLAPANVPIFHPYSDAPADGITVLAYPYEEAFGEKVRALGERTRPRDLYDVINLYRNTEARPSPAVLHDVLQQKCDFKGIAVPTFETLAGHRADLEGSWESMLGHQLPALPPLDSFWEALPEFFEWLAGGQIPASPTPYRMDAGETLVHARTVRLGLPAAAQSYLEIIRFAAGNRLLVELDYQGSTRRIEPYSLRQTREGNIILHAWNLDRDAHRSYRVDRIQGARTTNQSFTPRYAVELTPSGAVNVQPTARSASDSGLGGISRERTPRRPARPAARRRSGGPTYIYECGMCGKKFRRQHMSGQLNPHKTKDGWPCAGRLGILVDTKY
jgi:predicted nucleotidyltransferase component of viral defense system